MNEISSFSEIAKIGYRIKIEDLELLPEMVRKDNLQVICICNAGLNRSVNAAKAFNSKGINAVYLDGGLMDFTDPKVDQESGSEFIRAVPRRIVFIGESELRFYREVIDLLDAEVITTMRQR